MSDFIEVMAYLRLHSFVAVTIVFSLVLLATYWPGRRESIERHARIPFDDER
jgi:cbb3-type cytochrome oxidase subunit 3